MLSGRRVPCRARGFRSAVLAAPLFVLLGCVSAPRTRDVAPLSVLDRDASLYVYVPVQSYQALAGDLLQAAVQGMSEQDVRRIVSRTRDVYLALGARGAVSAQFVAAGAYPQAAVRAALSKKNGWKVQRLAAGAPTSAEADAPVFRQPYTYYLRTDAPVQLAFPQAGLACASMEVQPLVANYDAALFAEDSESNGTMPPTLWAFLAARDQTEIRFVVPDAAVIPRFSGGAVATETMSAQIVGGLQCAYGSIRQAEDASTCMVSATLVFSDERMARAMIAILRLTLLSSPAQVSANATSVTVSGYVLPWQTLRNMIVSPHGMQGLL